MHAIFGKRMIKVEDHRIRLQFKHKTVNDIAVGSTQRYQTARSKHLFIKFTVDKKIFTRNGIDILFRIRAEGFVRFGIEVKFEAFFLTENSFVESLNKSDSHTEYSPIGLFGRNFVHQRLGTIGIDAEKLICYLKIFSRFYFHCNRVIWL